jgi:hypothetical protein
MLNYLKEYIVNTYYSSLGLLVVYIILLLVVILLLF